MVHVTPTSVTTATTTSKVGTHDGIWDDFFSITISIGLRSSKSLSTTFLSLVLQQPIL